MSHLKLINPCLAILLVLAAGFPASTGVLCFGANGHVAIEAPHSSGSCDADSDALTSAHQRPQNNHTTATSPEDCADMPLSLAGDLINPDNSRTTDLLRITNHHTIDATLVAASPLVTHPSHFNGPSSHAMPHQTVSAMRTVLLQI